MNAGKSKYEIGTRIRIKNIHGEDSFLNGLTGKLTHPFGCYSSTYVGVWLENPPENINEVCNLQNENEFEVIK